MTRAFPDYLSKRKDLLLLHNVASYMLLSCGVIYVLSGVLCIGFLKRARQQKEVSREQAVKDLEGLLKHHDEIVDYFKTRGVSAVFLFRRNLLRRMISVLANSYDRNAKLLNGTHKSHTRSPNEAKILAGYKPIIITTVLLSKLKQIQKMTLKALAYFNTTRHIIVYYEDVVENHARLDDVLDFLKVPKRKLKSRQVKIHGGSFSQHVQNWEEVQSTLKGTSFESFLHQEF